MLFLLGIFAFLELSLALHLPQKISEFAAPFHHACRAFALVSSDPDLNHLYSAIVCGTPLNDPQLKIGLSKSGLLHLIVVSGSHIVFFERLIARSTRPFPRLEFFLWPLLALFALANGLEAIVMRAVFSLALTRVSAGYRFGWSPVLSQTFSGFAALGFCQTEADSISLMMSWICSLALQCFLSNRDERSNVRDQLKSHTAIYVLIAPALIGVSIPHPLSILCNLCFGPIIGLVLFPASLMALLAPPLSVLSDQLWHALRFLVSLAEAWLPAGSSRCTLSPAVLALYITILTIAAWRAEGELK